jgi:hypothetical protein
MVVSSRRSATFTSLPQEIRDQILTYALTSLNSIVVWSGKLKSILSARNGADRWDPEWREQMRTRVRQWRRVKDANATRESVAGLSLSLFLVSKSISQQATATFYKHNTFAFLGDHAWQEIVDWLISIGYRQRSLLSSLKMTANRPFRCYQQADGTRLWQTDLPEDPYPRSPHFTSVAGSISEGRVDNINPLVETVFALLKEAKEGAKVQLCFVMGYSYLPGFAIEPDIYIPNTRWWSLDLPNLVEVFREVGAGGRSIDVVWKAQLYRPSFQEHRKAIEQIWDIVEAEESEHRWDRPEQPTLPQLPQPGWDFRITPLVQLTLRKRAPPAVLRAAEPHEDAESPTFAEVSTAPWPYHVEIVRCLDQRQFLSIDNGPEYEQLTITRLRNS